MFYCIAEYQSLLSGRTAYDSRMSLQTGHISTDTIPIVNMACLGSTTPFWVVFLQAVSQRLKILSRCQRTLTLLPEAQKQY